VSDITSPQNPRVKAAARLRDRRHREKTGRILIDGARELGRAIRSGVSLVEVFVCRLQCQTPDAQQALELLGECGTEVLEVTGPVLEKLTFGHRSEGLLGVAEMPDQRLDRITLPDCPLVAVLEGIEKPGNLGAVLRSADGAGVAAVVAADPRTDLYNPNAIRASLGTIFTMPVAAATTAETIAWLRRHGLAVYAARVDGSVPYAQADFRRPAALVLGSEAQGLTAPWSGDWLTAIRLPMRGTADSLNVSATAAVLFYEALRQRSG
jgi:TrmH family RNA methyltransferase